MIIRIFLAFLKLYKFLGNICSLEQLFYRKKSLRCACIIHSKYFAVSNCRGGSTPVSTVLRKSVRFFTINIFNNKITIIELSKLKSGKQSGQMFSFSSFRALDRNPRKGTLGTLKIKKKIPGGSPRRLLPRPLV